MSDPTEQPTPTKTFDVGINDMIKGLINDLVEEATKPGSHGDSPRDKIRNYLKFQAGETTLHGITALSSYMTARSQERQAIAMESLAKTAGKLQVADSLESDGQSIIDQRESKRDYLATTYSLSYETLSFLWAIRGMLIDASLKALSKPTQFEPYRRVTTEELAWSLRVAPEKIWEKLPHSQGVIDYGILEEFDILHYGGTDEKPEDWMYGG